LLFSQRWLNHLLTEDTESFTVSFIITTTSWQF